MNNTSTRLADEAAERIVRHFQAQGFVGISEAFIIRIHLKDGERAGIEAAFEAAAERDEMTPIHQFFEIHPLGYFSTFRSFSEARAAIQTDFTESLRAEVPKAYFDPAPVVIDDPLASGTRYDVMMKLRDNVGSYAIAILLNDPDASFIDYIGTHHGNDWQRIMGEFEIATASLDAELI